LGVIKDNRQVTTVGCVVVGGGGSASWRGDCVAIAIQFIFYIYS